MAKPSEKPKQDDEFYSDEETAQRRDATLKRMLNTPPKPHKAKREEKRDGRGRSG